MADYYVIPTNIGEAKMANALALGIPLAITELALGDGEGEGARGTPVPNPEGTALISERRRAPLNSFSVDPDNSNVLIAEQVIPETAGGWWIREMGLFDEDGDMIFVCNTPPTYKPQLSEGSGRTQVVRMASIVSDTSAVTLKVDPSVVLATREYVQELLTVQSEEFDEKLDQRPITLISVAESISGLTGNEGQAYTVTGWHLGSNIGGGEFVFRASQSKSAHDGMNIISTTVPKVSMQVGEDLAAQTLNFLNGEGETDATGTGCFVRRDATYRPENAGVVIHDSRADAEAGLDYSGAMLYVILIARNAGSALVYPFRKFINVGAGVLTQPDGNYATTTWECNFTTLVRTKVGTTLYVRGGAAYQYIDDLLVDTAEAMWPTAVEATYDDVLKTITPNAEHNGIVIENTKAKIRAESYHNKGFNFHLATTGPNSNGCDYDFVSGNGGACSLYISGTTDDLSTSTLRYRTRSGAQGPLYWVEPTAALRQLTAFMAIENGLRDQSTPGLFPTQCYLGGSILCKYDIYSEIYAQLLSDSDEMLADENTSLCDITSHRANRDTDTQIDSTNTWRRPDGKPRKPFGTRSGVLFGITHAAAINSNFDHFVSFDVSGNDGTYGQVSGFANAIGFANRNPDGTGLKFQQMINSDGSGSRREYGNAGTSGHHESLAVTKGTLDAPAMFNAGDTVFTQTFRGRTAGNYNRIAEIKTVMTDVAAGANFAQGKMIFSVNPYSASDLVDVMEIHPSGNIKNPTPGKGIQLVSPNGTVYTVTVDDTGALVVA